MTTLEYLRWLDEDPREVKELRGILFVPIRIIQEDLFTGYFANTKIELFGISVGQTFIFGPGRLHYKHPITDEWLFQDGQAAVANTGNMILDYPKLGSEVIKSAAKKIGRRFGRDLNREDEAAFTEESVRTELRVIPKEDFSPKAKIPPDAAVIERYKKAIAEGDTRILEGLRDMYEFNEEPDVKES